MHTYVNLLSAWMDYLICCCVIVQNPSLTPPLIPNDSCSDLNVLWFNPTEETHSGCPMWDDLNDNSDAVFEVRAIIY